MLVLEACKHECVCASKFPHIHFLAYISLYLLLKVYIEGIPWGNLHSSTYIFPFSVHILHRCFCIPLIVCFLACVPAMSQLKEVLMHRSLHTPNNPCSAHTCSFVCASSNTCASEYTYLYLSTCFCKFYSFCKFLWTILHNTEFCCLSQCIILMWIKKIKYIYLYVLLLTSYCTWKLTSTCKYNSEHWEVFVTNTQIPLYRHKN